MIAADPPSEIEKRQAPRKRFLPFYAVVNEKFDIAMHVVMLCDMAERIESGEIKRGQVWMPPRHSKSETINIAFIAWFLGRNPSRKVIMACHTDTLTNRNGGRIRELIQSDVFKNIFPECQLSKDTASKTYFKTTEGGEFLATTVGTGAATGFGADLFVIDDPIKDMEQATSQVQREKIHSFYDAVASTRLEPGGRVLIVNTRWAEHDLSGWLLDPTAQQIIDDWEILSLPAIAEKDEYYRGMLFRREGEALWPSRWPLSHLLDVKKKRGQWVWYGLYQQRPSAIEGVYFLRKWMKYYMWNPHLAANPDAIKITTAPYEIFQSWDTNQEPDEKNDYAVCTTWLVTSFYIYLLDVWRTKPIVPDLFRAAKDLANYWHPKAVIVEKKSSGHGLIHELTTTTRLPVIAFDPQGKKEIRAQAISHFYESGRILLPHYGPFLKDFVDEHVAFPMAAHDDQVDSGSQFLLWLSMRDERVNRYEELVTAVPIPDINLFAV